MSKGFQHGGDEADLFRDAATYYNRFRRCYPPSVVSFLVETFGLNGSGTLLDGGCGTGQGFQVLAPHFERVLAFDADPAMAEFARQNAQRLQLDHVQVETLRAEDLPTSAGPFRLALFAASFHWMDQVAVAEKIYDLLEPGGALVILAPSGIHVGKSDWERAICEVLEEFLGPERRAGNGVYRRGDRHEVMLRRTRFQNIQTRDILEPEIWTLDEIVGFLYSTSFASTYVLGDLRPAFEAAIRERLEPLRVDGGFAKEQEHTLIWGCCQATA